MREGQDIRNVPLGALMDRISMVFQRVYLFQDTIYNNIATGSPDATRGDHKHLMELNGMYSHMVSLQGQ